MSALYQIRIARRDLNIKDALVYYLLFLAFMFLEVPLSILMIEPLENTKFFELFPAETAASYLKFLDALLLLFLQALLLLLVSFNHFGGQKFYEGLLAVGFKKVEAKVLFQSLLFGTVFGLLVLSLFYFEILPFELQRNPDENRFATVDLLSFILLFSVSFTLVPLFEEWLFRGVIFTGIYNSSGNGAAIFLSSVLFVGVHFRYFFYVSALPLFCIFFLSVVLGFVRSRTDSLVPGIIIHAAYNFVATFAGIKP